MSLKSKILCELESSRDNPISGQHIAEKYSVSRNAVWKAINSLKEDGHKIISSTNKGYILAEDSDILSEDGIRMKLLEINSKLPIYIYATIDSTNLEAKRLISSNQENSFFVLAEEQTAGRGRMQREFFSPKQTGLYMTLVINTHSLMSDAVAVTTMASVAVARAIEKLTDKIPQIKWVNDIYIENKKICGILTEAVSDFETQTTHSLIVGIGINVHTEYFPDEISGRVASLDVSGITRNELAAEVANNLLELSADFSDHSYMSYYREHSLVIGEDIIFSDFVSETKAHVTGINDDGGLIVETADGCKILHSGEITVRLDSGE